MNREEGGREEASGRPPASEEPRLFPALRLVARALLAELLRLWRILRAAGPPLARAAALTYAEIKRRAAPGGSFLARLRMPARRGARTPPPNISEAGPVLAAPASPPRRGRRRILLAGLLCGTAALLAVAGFLGYCAFTIPLSGGLAGRPEPAALLLETRAGKAFATRGVYRGEPVTAQALPATIAAAVVAIEDRRFFENPGIDLWGILRAAIHDLVTGSESQGASTITQQLARLTYLSPQRTIRRKVQEAMLALWLEARLGKKEILARYLNAAYFGNGAYGVDAAARRYFNKKAADLDLAQSAMLAGLIQAPSALAPTTNLAAAQQRAGVVLQAMVKAGDVTAAQAAAARAHPAAPVVLPQTEPGENYFADAAADEVQHLFGKAPPADLTVRTTLDPDLQRAAEQVVHRWLARDGRQRHAGEAALLALSPDGAVRAMVGGADYARSQFNRATEARRQPGSLFKIFVYLTAFNSGFTPDSVLVDKPVQIGDWRPRNYGRIYRGAVSLRTAFAQSINSISVQLGEQVGIPKIVAMAKSLGVKSPLQPVPSLALGSEGVTLFEMTRAMAEIAEDTKRLVPYTVGAVSGHNSAPLYKRPQTERRQPDWHRAPMLDILRTVVANGTGTNAALDRPAYGKTGTTNDYRDAWFVGFTDDYIIGVWVGNDDDSPMKGVVGGDLPARIWHDFAAEAERSKAGRGGSNTAAAGRGPGVEQQSLPPGSGSGTIRGVPIVVDTGTLRFNGQAVRLQGVEGEGGRAARDMAAYIGGREVTCEPAEAAAAEYRCRVGGYDLGEAVIYNGGGRAAADAPPALRSAEEQARLYRRGLWQR
ncbi:MAG TPA: PBP1A family penicillin-binding protein [Stellaceae bacterium]|nr:PBP1A family penicillin-binding protein [Stellaceae bacterium]